MVAHTVESTTHKAKSTARNVEITTRNIKISTRNIEIAACNDTARAKIEGKKRLLNEVLFPINGLNEDEALFMLQVLPKDEDQFKVFCELPTERKLRFCRVLLSRMSYCLPNS